MGRNRSGSAVKSPAITRVGVIVIAALLLLGATGCVPDAPEPKPTPAPSATPTPTSTPTGPTESIAGCPSGIAVSSGSELADAVASAVPGDVVLLEPGTYAGPFVIGSSGAEGAEITLCGGRDAIIDGGRGGYALQLVRASFWRLQGFSVSGGQKGLMLDGSSRNTITGLSVRRSGDEAIHLRTGSSDNLVASNEITQTGLRKARYGEGIYVGSAESNWCDLNGCQPDRSDRNRLIGNIISETTAESIDVKEGTTGGEIRGNTFDATGMSEADSYVDIKGSGWTIADNIGVNSPVDGAQVHVIDEGPGSGNVFSANRFAAGAEGYAINVLGDARDAGNRVLCNNAATEPSAAAVGRRISNVECVRG